MPDFGAKVSKRNYSVTDPDWKQLFHSGFPFMKVAFQGTGTLSKGSGSASVSVTIDHNLGYIPLVYVNGQIVTSEAGAVSSYFKKWPYRDTFFLHQYLVYTFSVTTTQLTISFTVPAETFQALAIALNYQYYICYDPAT